MLRSYDRVPFAEQEVDLNRMLNTLSVDRLSIDNMIFLRMLFDYDKMYLHR